MSSAERSRNPDRMLAPESPVYSPVVSVVPLKAARPEVIFNRAIASGVRPRDLWLTRAGFIKKSAKARNPWEVMPLHRHLASSWEKTALQEIRDELQYPVFAYGIEEPFQRRYAARLGDGSTIYRNEYTTCVYVHDIADPVGANPVDKIERPVEMTPEELSRTLLTNRYDAETPLMTSMVYTAGTDPLHPDVDADPGSVAGVRNYLSRNAFWFESKHRIRTICEMIRVHADYTSMLDMNLLQELASLEQLTSGTYSDFAAYCERMGYPGNFTEDMLDNPRLILDRLETYFDQMETAALRSGRVLMADYREAYENLYFRDILRIPTEVTQKPFLDAIALISRERVTPGMIEEIHQMSPLLHTILHTLSEAMDLPFYNSAGYFQELMEKLEDILEDPIKRAYTSIRFQAGLFSHGIPAGSELNLKLIQEIHRNSAQYKLDAWTLISEVAKTFRPLYPSDEAFANDFKITSALMVDPLILAGQAFGAGRNGVRTPEERFQAMRQLLLMTYSRELWDIYTTRVLNVPDTADHISAILEDRKQTAKVPVRHKYGVKEFLSFFRKVIERTPAWNIYDVHRTTLIANAETPVEGIDALYEVLSDTVQRLIASGKTVRISNIKMHPQLLPMIDKLQAQFGSGIRVFRSHRGSEAATLGAEVYWGKLVLFSADGRQEDPGIPMEIAFAAREIDMQEKEGNDPEFQLERLVTSNHLSVIDALFSHQPDLREKLLRYFHSRGYRSIEEIREKGTKGNGA